MISTPRRSPSYQAKNQFYHYMARCPAEVLRRQKGWDHVPQVCVSLEERKSMTRLSTREALFSMSTHTHKCQRRHMRRATGLGGKDERMSGYPRTHASYDIQPI